MRRIISVFQIEASSGAVLGRNLAVMALCLALLATALSDWIGFWLEPGAMPEAAVGDAQGSGQPQASREDPSAPPDIEAIITRNIFGGDPRPQAEDQQEQDEVALETIPLAKNLQNYALVGTIVSASRNNYAIINDRRKREQLLLQEGDPLEDASITRILRNNVIIQKDNQEQMLSIDYSARTLMDSSVGSQTGGGQAQEPETVFVDIDKDFVRKSLSDLQSFMRQAQIIPYMEDGQPAGYRLQSIRSGSAFDRLGLKDGDVILSLNGERIESPEQLMAFREELTNSDRASLQILRNGTTVDLEYSLN